MRAPLAERKLAAPRAFIREDAAMRRVKQASRKKRTTKAAAVTLVGAAGVGLSLFGSASGSTMPTKDIPQSGNTSPNQRFILGEEEMRDVSLATFHLFDRENVGSAIQLARGGCGGCGGCGHGGGGGCGGRGCGGGGGCGHAGFGGCGHVGIGGGCAGAGFVGGCHAGVVGGCHVGVVGGCHVGFGCRGCVGFRGCRGFRGCGCGGCGVVVFGDYGYDDYGYDDNGYGGACCRSWGACRLC